MKKLAVCCVAVLVVIAACGLSLAAPIPLIFDDDGSPDAVIALLYLLRSQDRPNHMYDVVAVTVCNGEANPRTRDYAQHLAQLLSDVGHGEIPIAAGRDLPLARNAEFTAFTNTFPAAWRTGVNSFWDKSPPGWDSQALDPLKAHRLIAKILRTSTVPVTILATGPLTNVAKALEEMDRVHWSKIKEVVIMGRALNHSGNISDAPKDDPRDPPYPDNTVAEWNFWVDSLAAYEVFHSGIPLRLVPLDVTDHIVWGKPDALKWGTATPEARWARTMLQIMLEGSGRTVAYGWDLDTAVIACNPASFSREPYPWLDVETRVRNSIGEYIQGQVTTTHLPANVRSRFHETPKVRVVSLGDPESMVLVGLVKKAVAKAFCDFWMI